MAIPCLRTTVYFVALACLAVDWYFRHVVDHELQTFVDHFPVTKYDSGPVYFLRFGPSRLARFPPGLLDRFDWLLDLFDGLSKAPMYHQFTRVVGLSTPERQEVRDPRHIFATASALPRILALAERDFDPGRSDRVLVLGGSDYHLSDALGRNHSERARTMVRIRRYFHAIFIESKDVSVDGVRVMPRGLSEHYLRRTSIPNAIAAIASADVHAKTRSTLMAFDYFSTFVDQPRLWDQVILRDAANLAKLNRNDALWYGNSSLAQEAGVEMLIIPATEWWGRLASYRFLVTPIGSGIVPPKLVEALLVLTVPIVQRFNFAAFDDLVRLGFPLAVVDTWLEVTAANLKEWWRVLSPRLVSFRYHCLTAEGYWRVFTGQVERCG